jgi:hypothetical protein
MTMKDMDPGASCRFCHTQRHLFTNQFGDEAPYWPDVGYEVKLKFLTIINKELEIKIDEDDYCHRYSHWHLSLGSFERCPIHPDAPFDVGFLNDLPAIRCSACSLDPTTAKQMGAYWDPTELTELCMWNYKQRYLRNKECATS